MIITEISHLHDFATFLNTPKHYITRVTLEFLLFAASKYGQTFCFAQPLKKTAIRRANPTEPIRTIRIPFLLLNSGSRVGGIDRRAFTASLDADEDFSSMFVKVIATNRQIDLRPLAIPPETGIRSRFPVDCGPLYDLIADALHGGFAASRGGITREVLPETWAAKSVFVDVER